MQVCPDREMLAALVAGNLGGAVLDRVAGHVDVCPKCQSMVQSAPCAVDPLLAALGRPDDAEPFLQEQACAVAVARFRQVPGPTEDATLAPDNSATPLACPEVETVAGRYRLGEEI